MNKEELMNESGDLIKSIKFRREDAISLSLEHEPLYRKHCAEVGYYKDIEPEMIWSEYFAFDKIGILRVFTARNSSGALIGYALYVVRQNLHYASSKIAICDMIYLLPEYRGGTGEDFISWIDDGLKAEGVQAVSHHAKVYYDFGSMLKRLNYEHIENIYARRFF